MTEFVFPINRRFLKWRKRGKVYIDNRKMEIADRKRNNCGCVSTFHHGFDAFDSFDHIHTTTT